MNRTRLKLIRDALIALFLWGWHMIVFAELQKYAFDIKEQSLSEGLVEFARIVDAPETPRARVNRIRISLR